MDVLEGNGREGEEGAPALLGDQFHASIRRSPARPTAHEAGTRLPCAHRRCEQPGARARDVTAEPRAGCALGLSRGRALGSGGPCRVPHLTTVQRSEPRRLLAARFSPFAPRPCAARSPWTATWTHLRPRGSATEDSASGGRAGPSLRASESPGTASW